MKNLKKFLALFAVTAMAFSFVACTADSDKDKDDDKKVEADDKDDKEDKEDKDNEKEDDKDVTAEGLLEDISLEDIESGSIEVVFALDVDMDLKQMMLDQGLTEDDIQDAIDEGEITEDQLFMSMVIDLEILADVTKDYSHITGSVSMDAMGMSEEVNLESYVDSTDKDVTITYTYDEFSDEWYFEEEDASDDEDEDMSDIISLITEYVDSAEITDEDDDVYTLSVVLDVAKMYEDESEMMDDLVDSSEDVIGETDDILADIENLEIIVEIEKETGYLSLISIDLADVLADYIASSIMDEEIESTESIEINDLKLEISFSDYNDVEVEIPEEVLENALEEVVDDFEDDDDEEIVTPADGTWDIYTWDDEYVGTVTIPEGYTVDEKYSDENGLYLEDEDWNSFDVDTYVPSWVEGIMEGEEFVPNLEDYTRQEVEERDSIETNQGTVRVFVEIWSMDEESDINYFETIVYVLDCGDNYLAVEGYIDEIEDSGYTVESLIQTLLQ